MENITTQRFAYVVPASSNYIEGLNAMFGSLEFWKNKADVVLVNFRLPEDFLEGLKKYSYNIRVIESEGEHQTEATAIERFRVAFEIGQEYDAICLLDADMFMTADNTDFLEAAAKGVIITGSNGMIINFNKAYQKQYSLDLGKDEWVYPKIHTTVPIFISKVDLDWFYELYHSRRIDHWDDFLYLNILGIKMGKDKKMICLPPYTFTGIHHFQMKPETAVFRKEDFLLSGTEEQVYMVHGKWWDKGWTQDLMPTMKKYFKDQMVGKKGREKTAMAIATLEGEFNRYVKFGKKTSK